MARSASGTEGENNLPFWLLQLPAEPSPRLTQLGNLKTRREGTGADLLESTFTLDKGGRHSVIEIGYANETAMSSLPLATA